ncbi:MAG TPA: hypothetical protein PLL30_06710 [Candidatus Krumholzibacteria bacterium]|nr:hypothetical protein [Candidatus Krumholzibacteria bacterium]HPD71453.1 hypothetical protein [Candidatus Krumholzibacteria bacterium]HRY41614.1 hypothetical protein [Candidatus Krumholzibacteria bacterium]
MRPPTGYHEFDRIRSAVVLGLFVGTGVGLGHLLAGVPGVELMTLNAALAGATLGAAAAVVVGLLSALVYSLTSPFGAPPQLLVLLAQMLGLAAAGVLGAALGRVIRSRPQPLAVALAGLSGAASAIGFDLATNLAFAVSTSLPVVPTLAAGLGFALVHMGTAAVAFASVLPVVAPRLARLRRPGPRVVRLAPAGILLVAAGGLGLGSASAQSTVPGVPANEVGAAAPADSLAAGIADTLAAPADSTASPPADSSAGRGPGDDRPQLVNGWLRPLWSPFSATYREDLARGTSWLPVADGGQGSAVVLFGEPNTSFAPSWERDGLPLGIGHRFLDDPEAMATFGHVLEATEYGYDGAGGLAGTLRLRPYDPVPDRDLVDTRWFKGPHETYLRDLHLLTADAPWRIGFDFGELLDNEGYDFRVPGEERYPEFDDFNQTDFWGHAKFRAGRGVLRRDLAGAGSVTVSLENVRKLKKAMPAYGSEFQDLWTDRAALAWQSPAGGRVAFWWTDADVDWDRERGFARKQEGALTGALASWGRTEAGGRLTATWSRWTLADSGADPSWAAGDTSGVHLEGEQASLRGEREGSLGAVRGGVELGAWWSQHGGWVVGGAARLAEARGRPRWSVGLEHAGRAPRADELATAWRFVVPGGRQTIALPDRGLDREDEWRLAASLTPRVAGFDLALAGAARRLRNGIGWRPEGGTGDTGRWHNGLELDSASVRAALAREGRFLGWIRLRAEGSWRTWRQHDDLRLALPPELAWRVSALWENHFFREDGILQLAAYLHGRGEMDDPWSLATPYPLPAATYLDAIVGFRLVGTDLSLELRNLTGSGNALSAGALASPAELRWRLNWVFHY